MTAKEILKKLQNTSTKIMTATKAIMHDDEACSYYIADDDIDKLDKLFTAYGKKTGSDVINHHNFVLLRQSNGIIDMHQLRKHVQDRLQHAKATSNVDEAVKATNILSNLRNFDYEMKYGADEIPASGFYSGDSIPQLDPAEVIHDVESSSEQYTVGPDIVYMFVLDLRNNILPRKVA